MTYTFTLLFEVSLCCWGKVVSSEVPKVRGAKRRDGTSVFNCSYDTDMAPMLMYHILYMVSGWCFIMLIYYIHQYGITIVILAFVAIPEAKSIRL